MGYVEAKCHDDPFPSRPDWTCAAQDCDEPWPCASERAELLGTFEHARLLLRMYMAAHMQDAIDDAIRHPSDVLIDFWPRFLGWIPQASSPPADATEGQVPNAAGAHRQRTSATTQHLNTARGSFVTQAGGRMYQAIASPQESTFIAIRPAQQAAMKLTAAYYAELADLADTDGQVPDWFADAARSAWHIEFAGRPINDVLVVRTPSVLPVTYSRASWEINKGCNFSCEHCYLEQRPFAGLALVDKFRLLDMLRDMGVIWFEITGGEPLIDADFVPAYKRAHAAGMMMEILTNGSRLHRDELLETFAVHRPHKITVSMYGASPETADALTQTRGAFKNAYRGMVAAAGAGLPVEVTLIITKHNVDELDQMRAMVRDLGLPFKEYASISPTYTGKGSTLAAQVPGLIGKSDIFQSCPAGHTSFHVDPLGFATMCKVGRDNPINVLTEGPDGLLRLPGIADAQMLRTGGCTGCKLSSTCRVCRPMARVYQEAKAPLNHYCQHGMKEDQ